MRSQNQTMTLCWAMWLPFDNGVIEQRETILQLTGGSQGFPSHRLVFTENPPLPYGKKVGSYAQNKNLIISCCQSLFTHRRNLTFINSFDDTIMPLCFLSV